MTYDDADKVLFSAAGFGTFGAHVTTVTSCPAFAQRSQSALTRVAGALPSGV